MKIAFTSTGTSWDSIIDPRFGRTAYLVIYDEQADTLSVFDNEEVKNEAHGAGTAMVQRIAALAPEVIITGNGPGDHALKALQHLKVEVFVGAHEMTLREAYQHYRAGKLSKI